VQIEAMRHAYVDRNSYLGDPDFVKNPLDRLLDKAYAGKIRAAIDPSKAAIGRGGPPSIEAVRDRFAHRNRERKLMLHWVIAGAFVTLGLIVVTVAAAVIAGNRFGMDFALADEADVRAAGPLVVLGVAVLAAFPAAGYLNARASSAGGLLEPALAAALTVGLLVGVLWLAAPIGVLLALAVAPVALALACGGAWIGLER